MLTKKLCQLAEKKSAIFLLFGVYPVANFDLLWYDIIDNVCSNEKGGFCVIYLDNAATTRPCEKAIEKASEIAKSFWGNPSSLHSLGLSAQLEVDRAREAVADALGAKPKNIIFTSGGTEANNLAISSAVKTLHRRGNRIVASAYEHSSVHEKLRALEKDGFEITFVSADKSGEVDPKRIADAVDEKTVLVAVMMTNNEVGAVNDIARIAKLVKQKNPNCLVHTDCVAAFGKIKINAVKLGVDTLSVSAHKIHGLKGCGALYIKDGIRVVGYTVGGEQERSIRPGTENTAGICAFCSAVEEIMPKLEENFKTAIALKNHLKDQIEKTDFIKINCENDFPYTVNISVEGLRSETLLHYLESREIFISSGSACAKGARTHVLESMGFDRKTQDNSVRISFSAENTVEDVDTLIQEIINAKNTLCGTK